ncbi:hypothetical protein, partial [Chitinimonas sp.]|uniref:hypothetical protein n=1 Tax=Chitinimonas sp. TaxID=1934313 RepID=UPI0035B2B12C
YVRGYRKGSLGRSFLVDGNGNATASIFNSLGFSADPRLIQLANKNVVFQTSDLQGGQQTYKFTAGSVLNQSRVSWRELINQ